MKKYPGVINVDTRRDGMRYRVSISILGYRPVYGGTFRDLDAAIDCADEIRWWAFKHALTKRAPKLERPERFTDESTIPPCPSEVLELADRKAARETPNSAPKPLSFSELMEQFHALTRRVAALEAAITKPKTINLKSHE